MNINLEGKTAIITGSVQGIGFDIAKIFTECGAAVVINNNRDSETLEAGDTLCNFVRSMTWSHLSGGRYFNRYVFTHA